MKKNYFIVVSIVEIIICLLLIVFSYNIAQNTVEALNMSMEFFNELESDLKLSESEEKALNTFNSLFETNDSELFDKMFDFSNEDFWIGYYQRYIIACCITVIVMSTITIIIAKNNHILRHKKRIIAYSIITFIIGGNALITLFGLINFIVILCLKRTEEDDYPIQKGKIVPLEKTYRSKKEIILGIVAIAAYVGFYIVFRKLLGLLFPNIFADKTFEVIIELLIDILVLFIILEIFKKELLNGIKAIKADFTHYRRFIRRRFIITIILSMAANVIRLVFTKNTTTENQLALFELPLWYLAPVAVIWAPIVEECVFRGALRRLIPNKYVFIIFSGVLFGVLHAISETSLFNAIISSIPYCIIGLSFAMAYEKSNNIITNIAMHALNNFIAIALMFIVMGA